MSSPRRNCNTYLDGINSLHRKFQEIKAQQDLLPIEAGQDFLEPVSEAAKKERAQYKTYDKQLFDITSQSEKLLESSTKCLIENCHTLFNRCVQKGTGMMAEGFENTSKSNYTECETSLEKCLAPFKKSHL